MKRLGLKTTDLLPVSLKMHAANNSDIKILGAILVKIAEPQGRRSSRQMVYITDHVSNLFLSRETCTDLGIIPTGFPTTLCSSTANQPAAITPDTPQPDTPRPCPCPRRSQPPPILSELPYPATEDNRDKLEKFLLDRYKASTFNTCDHQPLPLMDGPPLRLMIDPNAVPTAHHSPIYTCPPLLAGRSEAGPRPRCETRGPGTGPSWRTSDMVLSHGHMCQEKWVAASYDRLPAPQHTCDQRDPPHPITLPSGSLHSPQHPQECL